MNTTQKLIAGMIVTTMAMMSSGFALAAKDMSRKQITEQALSANPGSTVEKTRLEKKHGKEVWEVTLKDKNGKEQRLYYDARTGMAVHFDRKTGKEIKS